MAQSFFIWNDVDCRTMGVRLGGPVPIVRPEERVQHIEIPGRAGDLTLIQGDDIYNSYIQTASIQVASGAQVREVYKWLRGSGYVTFSGEPDRRQPARIIGAVTLNRHSRNIDVWTGEVQFYCQPFKEKLTDPTESWTANNKKIRNNGDITARPLWKITASGTSATLTVTGSGTPAQNAITVTGLQSGWIIWVDSETMEVWNTTQSATITQYSSGAFPVLAPGENTVTRSGISKIEVEKRERFL
jgi:phage-related protein